MLVEEFKVSNGKYNIAGTKYIPETNPKNIPIVLSHGFLSNQNDMKKYTIKFVEMGYTAYAFDYCGGSMKGKSEGDYSYMTIDHELNDLQAVINYVTEPKQKLILFGESQGGFISLLYASKNPAVVAKVLSIVPALCIPDDARKGQMLFMSFDPKDVKNTFKTKKGFNFSYTFAEDALRIDTVKMLKEVLCPVCMIMGGKDKIVDASYGRKALEVLSSDSFVYFVKKAGHIFKPKHIEEAFMHFNDFLKER